MKETIATQILLGFLLVHYVVSIDKISLKSEGDTLEGSLVSDLTVLAVERDFDIDYERVIDKFSSNHKNCRILLR